MNIAALTLRDFADYIDELSDGFDTDDTRGHVEIYKRAASDIRALCDDLDAARRDERHTISTAAGLPVVAAVELLADPLAVAMVRRGHRGYWLITRCDDQGAAAAMREAINNAAGVTIPQREAMTAGSMFGWHCPAADPRNYTAAGHVRPLDDETHAAGHRAPCPHCGDEHRDDSPCP